MQKLHLPVLYRDYKVIGILSVLSANSIYIYQDNYVKHFADLVKSAKPVRGTDPVLQAYNIDGDVRIQYRDQEDFERIAAKFGIFEEWKVLYMCVYMLSDFISMSFSA